MDWIFLLITVAKALLLIILVMSVSGYSVLAERKVAAWIQGRVGPNRTSIPLVAGIPLVGRWITRIGLIQLPADGLKFLFKEEPMPGHVNRFYYVLAPIVAFIPAMTTMVVIPFGQYVDADGVATAIALTQLDIGMLFILCVSSLGVYGLILAGWASNSTYPFIGGIRASAQLVSYELAMGMSLLPVFMWMGGSLSLFDVVTAQQGSIAYILPQWNVLLMPISAFVFLVALFAETNRLPFDMPESETDLVAGFNTEYGAFKFGLFFVGEYTHMFIGSTVFVLLFLGGWSHWPFTLIMDLPTGWLGAVLSVLILLIKTLFLVFFFMWIRWTLPRFRYDQIMSLGWKVLLPISIGNFVFYALLLAVIEQLS
jgi:NADH-quinone oxidoreductase subunit H